MNYPNPFFKNLVNLSFVLFIVTLSFTTATYGILIKNQTIEAYTVGSNGSSKTLQSGFFNDSYREARRSGMILWLCRLIPELLF